MRAFFVTRATIVGALGLTLVAVGCGGGGSSGSATDGGSDGGPEGGDDASGPGNDGGGRDGAPVDAGGQDAQDASMHTDGSADAGDAAPDAPAWTGTGVLATGVEAISFTAIGSTVYFEGTDAAHGDELWTTDITPQGTKLVYDACPGTCNGFQGDIVQVNGHTLFGAATSASPGTDATAFVLPSSGAPTPLYQSSAFGGTWQQGFAGSTLVYATQFGLWSTDGTTAGTTALGGLGNDHPDGVTGIGSHALVIAAQGGTSPVVLDLWGTDGTSAGMARLETGNATSRTVEAVSNGKGYVVAGNTLLTITDGTGAGTNTGVGGFFTQLSMFGVLASGTVVFEARTGSTATSGLYESDGTTVAQIGPEGPDYSPVNVGSAAVFPSGSDLVVTDGTAAGSSTLMSFSPNFVRTIAAAGSYVYFYVAPYTAQAGVQPQLWKTDGTAAGTTLVGDLSVCPPSGCTPSIYGGLASGSTLAFVVELGSGPFTYHLWSTGGTAATTHVISDSMYGFAFLPVGSGVLFSTTADDLRFEPL